MTRKLIVGAVAVGALAVTAGTAFALSSPNDAPGAAAAPVTTSTSTESSSATSAAGRLSADDASRIAVDRVPGTVDEVEREKEHGRAEWKVEIIAADGHTYDVRVDAETGAVTRVDQDDDRDGDDD